MTYRAGSLRVDLTQEACATAHADRTGPARQHELARTETHSTIEVALFV